MAVAAGQTFGNFQVVRLLGEGGFGEVYEAENPFLQRRAAIKIMHTGLDQDPELVRRFLNEARAASAIRHPNIIDVFDAGVTSEGEPYILMEFLEGDSLQKVILQQGAMPLRAVQEIARQAGSALSAAHNAGIVHRDLKPENLFLIPDTGSPTGFRVKVLDFGIAKIKHRDDQGSTLKTQAGLLMGSPSYMSPEQCRDSSDVDLRSDIYSFGIIVYEMLAGVPPFASDSATEMLVLQITAEPPPLRQRVAGLPEYVEHTVMRALAKDREKRFASVDYFVGALHGTYPALTSPGSATLSPSDLARPLGQSLYSAQGFGYQRTPPPMLLGGAASRVGITPAPVSPTNQTITTLSQAKGEAVSASPDFASEVEMAAIKRRRWPLLLGVGVLAVAGALLFSYRAAGPPAARRGAPASTPAVAAAKAPQTAQPAKVLVRVRTSPAGATVSDAKDGSVLGQTPLEKWFAQGHSTLDLLLRLQGYKDKTVTVGLDGNATMVVELEREKTAADDSARKASRPAARSRRSGATRKPPKTTRHKDDEWLVH
ncbi:MAG: serine/threonine protein kinase [Deltaproteobacteria bacterium]|nr:serine/threonine protein kinase [Deltaproteobacteria bacterium]